MTNGKPLHAADAVMERFSAVLCRAEGPSNVGAVCRAIKTMGCENLTLAACPEFDPDLVRTSALGAWDVYERAERHASLESALDGCSLAVGFTRRRGGRRKAGLELGNLAKTIMDRSGRVALVFGNERDGLSSAELALCDLAVWIPSSDAFPSLNLSHAVQLAFWELRRHALARTGGASVAGGQGAATRDDYGRTASHICDSLSTIGFFKIAGRDDTQRFLATLSARAALTHDELDRLAALFAKRSALLSRGSA